MATTINLKKLVHRKQAEMCAYNPYISTGAGHFMVGDKTNCLPGARNVYYVGGASSIYLYSPAEDAWTQIPNSGIAGTFASGSCGDLNPLGMWGGTPTTTATAGTTTSFTTSKALVTSLAGVKVMCVDGAGVGYVGTITGNDYTTGGATVGLTPASAVAFNSTSVFKIWSGSLWFFNAGTTSVGFSVYDIASNAWTAKSVTNLPTAWGIDGQLLSTPSVSSANVVDTSAGGNTSTTLTFGAGLPAVCRVPNVMSTGLSTVRITSGTGAGQIRTVASNTATALTVTAAWTVTPDATSKYELRGLDSGISSGSNTTTTLNSTSFPNCTNFQVRITGGTGIGQVRTIASNTGTTLTITPAWTITPDTTSTYAIEGNDEHIYLLGNGAVTMYRYTISTNTWATISPITARGGVPASGFTADWVNTIKDPRYLSVAGMNGNYIYSFRANGTSLLDSYHIGLNMWVAGVPGTYGNQGEVIAASSCSVNYNGIIYLQNGSSGRMYGYDVANQRLDPFAVNVYPNSTAVTGDKMFVQTYSDDAFPPNQINWLYSLNHTSNVLQRWLII